MDYGKPLKSYDPRNPWPEDVEQFCRDKVDTLQKSLVVDVPTGP